MATISTSTVLVQLATALVSGKVRIVDLAKTLSPETLVLVLPSQFGRHDGGRLEDQ